jgi:hypothetical protein
MCSHPENCLSLFYWPPIQTESYRPLLGHTWCESLRRLMMQRDSYMEMVVAGGSDSRPRRMPKSSLIGQAESDGVYTAAEPGAGGSATGVSGLWRTQVIVTCFFVVIVQLMLKLKSAAIVLYCVCTTKWYSYGAVATGHEQCLQDVTVPLEVSWGVHACMCAYVFTLAWRILERQDASRNGYGLRRFCLVQHLA